MNTTGLQTQVLGLIGLARRARQIVDGQDRIVAAIAGGKAKLVLVTSDAGENGRKKLHDKGDFYGVPVMTFSEKAQLGPCIGRREAAAIAILDDGFARKLQQRISELHGGGAF